MTETALSHSLDRTVVIEAEPGIVFRYFTDSDRWASWWGKGSTIEPHVGGRVLIRHPGGVEVSGEVTDVQPPQRIAFTYGYASGTASAAETSLVTIRLEPQGRGATRLHLHHAFADASQRDEHAQGWRYQLSLFGNLVASEAFAGAADVVDGWFVAWSDPDASTREATLARIASEQVRFRDRFSLIDGMDDLRPHLAAVHRFMPGMRLERDGDVRHCQGTVLADWIARGADGQERGRGTNVFVLGAGARIESVTGFWNPPRA
jgi:uncharacterized protein YndB with AHSA1/START domain